MIRRFEYQQNCDLLSELKILGFLTEPTVSISKYPFRPSKDYRLGVTDRADIFSTFSE